MMYRIIPVLSKWPFIYRGVSSASKSITELKSTPIATPVDQDNAGKNESSIKEHAENETNAVTTQKPKLVAQVFANLKSMPQSAPKSSQNIDKQIKEAKDVNTLLEIAASKNLTRKSALSILSIFGDWTGTKKAKLSDFENDMRFLTMCRMLSNDFKNRQELGDLATVLGVTGDDQAAKLIESANLSQMVRIMEKLSANKKRSAPLLRSLAFNMGRNEDKLNIKQCADVLYAMANLSFHDEVLLAKVCGDAISVIAVDVKSAVVGSIARSLGIMRCRDTVLLDKLAEWLERNFVQARPQDAVAILMALASVAYLPDNAENLFKILIPILRPLDLPSAGLYLDAVWSLLLLEKHTQQHIAVVLSTDFIEKLRREDSSKLSQSTELKLLNVNAAAQYLIPNYQGPKLHKEFKSSALLTRSKDKIALVNCVFDSLSNLLPGENFLRRDIDSGAGFLIDGECLIGNNCIPLPLTKPAPPSSGASRVAIMVLGYHDTCVAARFHSNGVQLFSKRLLEAKGYKVLNVLHSEFSRSSKLVFRVQYLEQKIKLLVAT